MSPYGHPSSSAFPGKRRNGLKSLLDFVREARFDHLGAFVYSREEGTAAALRLSRISEKEKTRRRNMIMEDQAVISYEINQGLIGSRQEVLVEGENKRCARFSLRGPMPPPGPGNRRRYLSPGGHSLLPAIS